MEIERNHLEMSTENRWDKLFASRTTVLPAEPWLTNHSDLLKKGKILDLGAGDGRNTLFLAYRGFEVTAVDYSREGLYKITQKKIPSVRTIKADCNSSREIMQLGKYDSLLLSHFVPDSEALKALPHVLVERGTVLMVAFAPAMKEQRDFSINLILDFDELERTLPGLEYLVKESWHDDRGYFNGCVFRFS